MNEDRPPTTPDVPTRITLRAPEDLVALVPSLLGYHPEESLVVLGVRGPLGSCALRADLTPTIEPDVAARMAEIIAGHRFTVACLVGYGQHDQVFPAIGLVSTALLIHDVEVAAALRVAEGRWWSYTCDDPACCPPDGTPFETTTTVIAAQTTYAGMAVLPNRDELTRSVAAVNGEARQAIRQATQRAENRFVQWCAQQTPPESLRSRMAQEATPLIEDLYQRARNGDTLPTDDEIAWLGILLTDLRVRDEAWIRIGEPLDPYVTLWQNVLRRVEEAYAAPPAALLAFAAYRTGNGALANVALDRALAADPDYSMANLLRHIIAAGVAPEDLDIKVTPEELAADYAEYEPAHLPSDVAPREGSDRE